MKVFLYILLLSIVTLSCSNNNTTKRQKIINWQQLETPIYYHPDWSVKDACMIYADSVFYVFFSAFYHDDYDPAKRLRSHVTCIKTKDFITFSDTLFMWDGINQGWYGMCSPNIIRANGRYFLTYNSWGDKDGKPNQLFYAVSDNLEDWDKHKPLAHNLTSGIRAIDAGMNYHNGYFYLIWKESKGIGRDNRVDLSRLAKSKHPSDNFNFVYSGYPDFRLKDGSPNEKIHENYEFIKIDNKWHLLCTDYFPHNPFLYEIGGNPDEPGNWLVWKDGRELAIPIVNGFNTDHHANAAFLADWTAYDGYYYLLFAGRTHDSTFWKRGNNKLGIARSKNLLKWELP